MVDLPNDTLLNRRKFLRIVGFVAGSVALAPFLSASRPVDDSYTEYSNQIYRGSPDGKLFASSDGKNWSAITNFGPNIDVRDVTTSRDGWIHATLELNSHRFVLKSRDQKVWYTQDYTAPGKV